MYRLGADEMFHVHRFACAEQRPIEYGMSFVG